MTLHTLTTEKYDQSIGPTAWRFFDACTEIAKDGGIWSLPPRTTALHGLMDQEVGITFSRN
jgi:hypothetical protein